MKASLQTLTAHVCLPRGLQSLLLAIRALRMAVLQGWWPSLLRICPGRPPPTQWCGWGSAVCDWGQSHPRAVGGYRLVRLGSVLMPQWEPGQSCWDAA